MTNPRAYALTFEALELLAGACSIDSRRLHHRYHGGAALGTLRTAAAARLRAARRIDRATVATVWARHRPQVSAPPP